MGRKDVKLCLVLASLIFILTLSIQVVKGGFTESDPKADDPKYVEECLDRCISEGNRKEANKIENYAADRAGEYGALILVEFNEELTLEKIQQMKQKSPSRWKMFNRYLAKAIKWINISLKASRFTGSDLAKK